MKLYYDPLKRECKSRVGAVPRGSDTTLYLYETEGGEDNFSADACTLLLRRDGCDAEEYSMRRTERGWTIALRFHETGLYFYSFRVGERRFGCGKLRRGAFSDDAEDWQITVFSEDYETPEWFKGGTMYQIFPDRFAKSGELAVGEGRIARRWGETPFFRPNEKGKVLNNDFFGGNFNGIRSKLPYLASLGVTAIYLNPVFESASNHRYNTGNYFKLDPLLGTEEDFDALIREARERGIRVILDGVFNHTGSDSIYFNREGHYPSVGAYQSPESPYTDWFRFRHFPNDYDCWWGIDTLPAVNEHSTGYQNFILGEDGVVRHWMRHGVSGYRLDVADELPDFFIQRLRSAVKTEDPEAIIIGEVWEDASNKIAYGQRRSYFQGEELDSVMNYPLKNAMIRFLLSGNSYELRNTIFTLIDHYPPQSLHALMNILGTHDTPRILTVLGGRSCSDKEEMATARLGEEEKTRARRLLKMATVLQYTLPGVPCIYYGDENGMEGYADPFCRRCFDWTNTDEELTAHYKKLGAIRAAHADVFRTGEYRELFADASCIVYERREGARSVQAFVNRSGASYSVSARGTFEELLTGERFCGEFTIPPFSCGILTKIA